ncbi:GNAT family N-acetyltransferase [Neptunicella marina]|uniref:GNAT family N-acetyltransferase n=1 Tax=Neptunicella marina TaxID=2125989 RepID=A0A8J6LWV6_9ALTE|nr:N-acetyltransferase [Neptunicella marina]MBC3764420.1 GNAT family N-acetyltransferase [Neptunicella marina]
MTTTIRRATPDDINALVNFNQAMAHETEGKVLDKDTLTQGVARLINQPEYGFYLVAETDGEIAAGLMVTYEWSDWRNGLFWWIQSVYVMPDFRRQGLYTALYNEVKALAEKQTGVCGFRLYVEKENIAAQKTYQALGMQECEYFMYQNK